MNNVIEFYESPVGNCPVEDFLDDLPIKHRAKAIRSIELLEHFGTQLSAPHVKRIQGQRYEGLFELRIKFSSNISRILYFLYDGKKFILLHGFIKKSKKTPKKELELARNRMLEILERG